MSRFPRLPLVGSRWAAMPLVLLLLPASFAAASEESRPPEVIRLQEQRVVGEREPAPVPRFLPDVQGTQIYAGKKTTVIEPERLPQVTNDNYRQVLSRVPGLFLSEESTPLVSIGYRGLDPHRMQFMNPLKDGIPIHADMMGYPEAYYLPPVDALQRIDFIRGGASLLYGPQVGGALNFVTRQPNPDRPLSLRTNQSFGSYGFYSTYTEASGTSGDLGYHAYYYQKQGDGFRARNSDFGLYSGSAMMTYALNETNRLRLAFDGYSEEHGEPGGLSREGFASNRNQTNREFDRFQLQRFAPSAIWESELSADTQMRVALFGHRYTRWSARQRGGSFGQAPSGADAATNSIEDQRFNTFGVDSRVRHDWQALGENHTLSAGAMYYYTDSPRTDMRGATPDAVSGAVRNENVRNTNYGAVFAENRFGWGRLSLIPSVRLENYALSVREFINVSKTQAGQALANKSDFTFMPLFGFGAMYSLLPSIEVYGNASSSYRPAIFTQAVTAAANQSVADDLSPGSAFQYEVGLRGRPTSWVTWDTSLFWLDFQNQIGTVQLPDGSSQIRNVGRARHMGWEVSGELAFVALVDSLRGSSLAAAFGEVSLFTNLTLQDAEFIGGPFKGKTPMYAADTLVRGGVQYEHPRFARISLLTTAVGNAFANDNNTANFAVPNYQVWDLLLEGKVWGDRVALFGGVNNLFNENYFARVRADGIDPAFLRNYVGGVRLNF